MQRELGIGPRLLDELPLEIHGGPDRLSGGFEHHQGLVAAHLDQRPVPHLYALADEVAELRRESRRELVAALLREARIAADVCDQKRADRCVWCVSQGSLLGLRRSTATEPKPLFGLQAEWYAARE